MGTFKPPRDESDDELYDPPNSEPWDRSRRRVFRSDKWHRRIGTRFIGGLYGGSFLDGGHDEPLDRHGLEVWHLVVGVVAALGVLVVALAYMSR
jgi:hypothetical protein